MGGFLRQAFSGLVSEELGRCVTFALTLSASSVCGSTDVAGPTKYSRRGWLNGGKSDSASIAFVVLCFWLRERETRTPLSKHRSGGCLCWLEGLRLLATRRSIRNTFIQTWRGPVPPPCAPGTRKLESSRHSLQRQTESILSNLSARGRFWESEYAVDEEGGFSAHRFLTPWEQEKTALARAARGLPFSGAAHSTREGPGKLGVFAGATRSE